MRQLLAAGVDPHELRTLEDLRNDLAGAGKGVWEPGSGGNGSAKTPKSGGDKGADVAPKRA
jgi:hypothetical protein